MNIPFEIGEKVYIVDTFFLEPEVKEREVTGICLELGKGLARYIYSATAENMVFKERKDAEEYAEKIKIVNSGKAYWDILDDGRTKCSICGKEYGPDFEPGNFCGNCGVQMICVDCKGKIINGQPTD